ncbi:NUDIX domain-containing protein [Actibacterium lipolyticum]|uniref:Nudix hydrolase domain-containing protein n=1 Tax=Actibacterium lipolyticum TaxID=1524263 RepID=A0A238KSH5_9RHOB|nr:NUDIX domain-containing protein [Actibacterium lipolyticum]SMX45789.1 hypothetical protein COL8621_02891 [Actibacterium lipolyticum]
MTDRAAFAAIGALPERIEFEAAIVIARDSSDRILMQLRDDIPKIAAPGMWCLFGGGQEGQETLAQAAQREFWEETGVMLGPDELSPFARIATAARPDGVLYAYQSLRLLTPDAIKLGEGAGFAFLTASQIENLPVVRSSRLVIEHFFSQL